jgi:hypothetical protein
MAEKERPEPETTHAERVRRKRANRSLKVLPSGSKDQWPANLGELLEWHTTEVDEVTRAARLRLLDTATIIEDYRRGRIDFDEAVERVEAHETKWGETFPGGITGTRSMSDEEINKSIDEFRQRRIRGGRS